MDAPLLEESLSNAREALLRHRTRNGAWTGRLSSSALSTATASMAFALSARARPVDSSLRADHERLAADGRVWLCDHQNEDGGWGDTKDSPSNISTTTLCWVGLGLAAEPTPGSVEALARAREWLQRDCGDLAPDIFAARIRASYGKDHTFSVPILTTCALGGRLGAGREGWRLVPSLPFELAACPRGWFRVLRLRTVSYALPALIAIGQARHHHRPTRNPLLRAVRCLVRGRTLRILREIQPESGGFLEAAPLTSFVSMSLVSIGQQDHPVVEAGLGFLADTVRDDGSWPIDTNLDLWLTSLSVGALAQSDSDDTPSWDADHRSGTREWLRRKQYVDEHPYTSADAGGWAWTDLSGGVPDADDTSCALLAIHALSGRESDPEASGHADAAARGVTWLLDLQNRDGGIPTFCRGWGRLPFDRSSPDLTAHALRAFMAWRPSLAAALREQAGRATSRAVRFLIGTQRDDGAWIPLWFGNQAETAKENPLYGTTRVLRAVSAVRCEGGLDDAWTASGARALRWVLDVQAADGGFGAASSVPTSVEETALAVEALAEWLLRRPACARTRSLEAPLRAAVERGSRWLCERTDRGNRFDAAPIGLYFARLWYSEMLYPVIFTVSALGLVRRCLTASAPSAAPGESDPCLETR